MHIKEEINHEIQIYKIDGVLDSNTATTFKKNIAEAMRFGKRRMIFDFQNLEYLSSAGLRVIIQIHKDLKHLKGKVVLCCMADYIKEIFEISGLDSFLPITIGQDDALRLFS